MNPYISLDDFKYSIVQQAETIAQHQMPGKYDSEFNLKKSIDLYYAAQELSRTAPVSVFIETINDAITDTIAFDSDENDADFIKARNYISNQIYRLTFISNFIALAMEK